MNDRQWIMSFILLIYLTYLKASTEDLTQRRRLPEEDEEEEDVEYDLRLRRGESEELFELELELEEVSLDDEDR